MAPQTDPAPGTRQADPPVGSDPMVFLARGDARIHPQHQYIHTLCLSNAVSWALRWGKFKVRTNKHMKSISPGELAPLQSGCLILISFPLVQLKGGASGKAAPRIFSEKTQNKTDLRSLCVCVWRCVCVCVCVCGLLGGVFYKCRLSQVG